MLQQNINASLILAVLISIGIIACQAAVMGSDYRSVQAPMTNQIDEYPTSGDMSPTDRQMSPEMLDNVLKALQYNLVKRREVDDAARRLRNQINIVHMALEDLSNQARIGQLSALPNEPIIPTIVYAQPTSGPVPVKRETARWNQLRGMWG